MKRLTTALAILLTTIGSVASHAQTASRNVAYHSQDIVPIHAKVKYTTLIVIPASEKIMEAATGDKDFWIVDVVGNFCFVHPAKAGISSNLNLITDKGNIYSFTLTDVTGQSEEPDLKVIIQPADASNIVAANGPPQYVPAAQLEQARQQLATVEAHVGATVDEFKSAYPLALKFDYAFKTNEEPFDRAIQLNPNLTFAVSNRRIALLKQTQQSQVGQPYPSQNSTATSPTNSYSAPIVHRPPSAYEPHSLNGGSYEDTLQSARTALQRKDSRGAYKLATQARDLEPNSLPALELLQVILAEGSDPARAESAALEAIKHGGKAVFELQHYHAWPTGLHAARLVITAKSLEFVPEAACKYADFTIPLASIKSVDVGENTFNAYLLDIKLDDSQERKGREGKGQISFSDSSSTLSTLGSVYRVSSRRSMPQQTALFSVIRDTILNAKAQP